MQIKKQLKTIGRIDKADFPDLGLENIEVKIDTGAFTSAVHCHNIREEVVNGQKKIHFNLLDPSHPEYDEKEYYFEDYSIKSIKSSNGQTEIRYIINTIIVLFGIDYPISLSLSDRAEMKFPILIGRALLRNNFIVDVARTNRSFKKKIKTF